MSEATDYERVRAITKCVYCGELFVKIAQRCWWNRAHKYGPNCGACDAFGSAVVHEKAALAMRKKSLLK